MPTSVQKRAASKKGRAVRDITVKKIRTENDEGFQVQPIHNESNDMPTVEPLVSPAALRNERHSVEDDVEEALASIDDDSGKTQVFEETAPRDLVKVKFAKFVQLVTSRDCADVIDANLDEDVVMSSNLLTELAGAHDEREEKKIPLVFLVGLAIGVVLTYILIMK